MSNPDQPGGPSKNSLPTAGKIAIAAAGLLLIFGVAEASNSSGPESSASSFPSSASEPTSSVTQSQPADTTSALSTQTGTSGVSQAIAAWYTGGAKDLMQAISADDTAMSTDSSALDSTALGADCRKLQTDVANAQQYGPMPDLQGNEHWRMALFDYSAAATDCIAGTDNSDADALAKSSAMLTEATSEESLITARIQEINNGG